MSRTVGFSHKSSDPLLKEFVCMPMVKNYFHFNQIGTIYRDVKSSKSMKGTDLSELEECDLERA